MSARGLALAASAVHDVREAVGEPATHGQGLVGAPATDDMAQARRDAQRLAFHRQASDDRRLKHIVIAERRRSSINAHDQKRIIEEAAKVERRRRQAEVCAYEHAYGPAITTTHAPMPRDHTSGLAR
eukprot:3635131-Prymnesium_polylepis.2